MLYNDPEVERLAGIINDNWKRRISTAISKILLIFSNNDKNIELRELNEEY